MHHFFLIQDIVIIIVIKPSSTIVSKKKLGLIILNYFPPNLQSSYGNPRVSGKPKSDSIRDNLFN